MASIGVPNQEFPQPKVWVSLIPLVVLISLMVANVAIFKEDATAGPNQIALLMAGLCAGIIGHFTLNIPYKDLEKGMLQSISLAMGACLILLMIGPLMAIWILSGIVPVLIYYGLKLIIPTVFLPVACLCCIIVSSSTGSSWTTTGTVGIALMAIGKTYGIPDGMVAGAIISGAYFGDKMSPLSDTTNLAPAMAGTDLFTHIRHMMFTSGPAIVITLISFSFMGLFYGSAATAPGEIQTLIGAIEGQFSLNPTLLLVPVIVFLLVRKKVPAVPSLIAGTVLGVVMALIFQRPLLESLAYQTQSSNYKIILSTLVSGFNMQSGHAVLDALFNRGGMEGMLNTIWLIICAMVFGGLLERTGMLHTLAQVILSWVRGTGSLIGATLFSCVFTNATASDQYVAIVVPGRMFKKAYDDYGLHPKNLSRAVEDSATVTSVLIPWNSCAAYFSGVLGVSTLVYLPFCLFNLLSPLISATLGATGWTIEKNSAANTTRPVKSLSQT